MNILKKIVTILFSLLLLCSCAKEKKKEYIENIDDINGLKIAMATGSCYEDAIKERFPDSEYNYYNYQTVYDAIISNKVDVTFAEYPRAAAALAQLPELTMIPAPLAESSDAFGFPLNSEKLYEEMNSFIVELTSNGTLDEIKKKWFDDLSTDNIDYENLTGVNGTLKVALVSSNMPYAFYSNNEITGLEPDLIYRFCLANGYDVEFIELDLPGILAALSTGGCDFAAGSLTITEERKETMKFTTPYYSDGVVAVIRKADLKSQEFSLESLKGKTVSCVTASVYEKMAMDAIDDVNIKGFSTLADSISALSSSKVDAVACSKNAADNVIKEVDDLIILTEIGYDEFGLVAKKDDEGFAYKTQFNNFLSEYKEKGKLEELKNKYNDVDSASMPDYQLTGENGALAVVIDATCGAPYDYIKDGKLIGYEVELLYEFAKEYGYDLEISETDFAGVMAAVTSGKAIFGSASITITEERAESVYFTDIIDATPVVLIGRKDVDLNSTSFIEDFKNNFNKTFVREARWKMFLQGTASTLLISAATILFGLILGFALYLLFRTNNKIVNVLIRLYSWLINGMPTVVLLMVLFYIVFAKSSLNGTIISIIGFTIIFSITIFGLLKNSFDAIDIGQFEASYALGYSKINTFFKIILPQTMPMFLPSFKSEVVSLIKATSIVGYIAVQDLTKMSDLVRCRTYEAFFPLIGATVLYFLIAAIFNIAIKTLMKATDPKRRSKDKILKGVKTR